MELSLSAFKSRPATDVVSLGPRCATAYNLRKYFGFETAYPFDWWITPESGLLQFLGTLDLEELYNPELLFRLPDGSSVQHNPTGILLHHEFPRDLGKVEHPVIENFIDYIEQPRSRSEYLLERFKSLNDPGRRVLFFREGEARSAKLTAELERLFPLAEWCLCSLPLIPEDPVNGWKTDFGLWKANLDSVGVQLQSNSRLPPSARG
ncbi:hypothetical protein [Oryzifoliimicrobium ureilyticus]|uniref:hypothetical protein n=1 Tax=Oryzifoliimicrobium ureilyticus TaxID=3113724 RepID=UPI0030761C6F